MAWSVRQCQLLGWGVGIRDSDALWYMQWHSKICRVISFLFSCSAVHTKKDTLHLQSLPCYFRQQQQRCLQPWKWANQIYLFFINVLPRLPLPYPAVSSMQPLYLWSTCDLPVIYLWSTCDLLITELFKLLSTCLSLCTCSAASGTSSLPPSSCDTCFCLSISPRGRWSHRQPCLWSHWWQAEPCKRQNAPGAATEPRGHPL